jgi:hypothetical protein
MSETKERCTVCGKKLETGGTICQQCQDSIRGEAAGKRKKIAGEARKAMRKHGQKPPTH